jgi:hypothetical protein
MSWKCPGCGETNDDGYVKCVCGHELFSGLNQSIDQHSPQVTPDSLNQSSCKSAMVSPESYKRINPIHSALGCLAGLLVSFCVVLLSEPNRIFWLACLV